MAKMTVIVRALATSNEGDAYGSVEKKSHPGSLVPSLLDLGVRLSIVVGPEGPCDIQTILRFARQIKRLK